MARTLDKNRASPVVSPLDLFSGSYVESGFNWPRRPEWLNAEAIDEEDGQSD